MAKKRAIVSYDKLTVDQKRQLVEDFPDGFAGGMTQIKTPTGEVLDALLWETEETIYLVKLNKPQVKSVKIDDDEDEEDFDIIPADDVKGEEDDVADDDDDDYDDKDDADDEDDEDED